MSNDVKYVTLLYLLNQNTSNEKLKETTKCEKHYNETHKQEVFSFE